MPDPRRSAGRVVPRRGPQVGGAAAPNQTRRTAHARTPGAVTDPVPTGEAPLIETDSVITSQTMPPAPHDVETAPGPPDPIEIAGLLHELSQRLLSTDDVTQALDRLAVFTVGAVPGAVRCSVVSITEGEPLTLTASGGEGRMVDDCQYRTGQGPGLDAARTRTMVTSQDLAVDARWPALAECARDEGVQSVAAIPLDVQRESVGALSLFVRGTGGIVPELLLTSMAIVNQAEILLGELSRRAALSKGATVDRAIGVIIAQRGCGVREAYDVLQETAQRLGLDRQSVAERLIAAAARTREPGHCLKLGRTNEMVSATSSRARSSSPR